MAEFTYNGQRVSCQDGSTIERIWEKNPAFVRVIEKPSKSPVKKPKPVESEQASK